MASEADGDLTGLADSIFRLYNKRGGAAMRFRNNLLRFAKEQDSGDLDEAMRESPSLPLFHKRQDGRAQRAAAPSIRPLRFG